MGESNQFKQTPGRALLAFAITAALVAVFTVVDARRRAELEGYDFPTALGDREWFDFAEDFVPDKPVMQFGGVSLFRLRDKALVRFDGYMFKVGREDDDRCFLYRYARPRSGQRTPEGIYYAKIGEGSYIELGVEPKGSSRSAEDEGLPPGDGSLN